MSARHMTQSDLLSWNMEQDPMLRSTIVVIAILDTRPDWDRLVHLIDRGTRVEPLFRSRVVTAPLGLAPPHWVIDPGFDLSWHLRRLALPAPAGLAAVLDFARTVGTTAFDKARPLWEFTLLEGLDGDRSALVMKVHHALTDGVGGMQIAAEIVDFAREGTDRGPLPDPPASQAQGAASTVTDALAWNWSTGVDAVRRGGAAFLPALRRTVIDPVGAVRDVAAAAGSMARYARPVVDTLSPVMTERSLGRRFAVLDVPLEALRRAADSHDSTVNDAFLAAVLIGLRRYHALHGADASTLRVNLPISVRTASDPLGGNRITLARFTLPLDVTDPTELMHRVDETVEAWRNEPAVPLSGTIAGLLNLLPPSFLGAMFKHVDFLASNIPGTPVPIYLAGAEVTRFYPFSPTLGAAFNVTLMSHTDTCCVGINADPAAVPDPEVLADCLAAGFRTILELCGDDALERTVVDPAAGTG